MVESYCTRNFDDLHRRVMGVLSITEEDPDILSIYDHAVSVSILRQIFQECCGVKVSEEEALRSIVTETINKLNKTLDSLNPRL